MGRNAVMIVKLHIKKAARFCFHRGRMMRNDRPWMPDHEELRKSIVDGEGVLNVADRRW